MKYGVSAAQQVTTGLVPGPEGKIEQEPLRDGTKVG